MKVVIGYDGSKQADEALNDLRRAGLPRDVEAIIVSIADVMAPPPDSALVEKAFVSRRATSAMAQASYALAEARECARAGGERVKALFPGWDVKAEYMTGAPADSLMKRSRDFGADLIVVGSQGRSALGRLIIGSVSRKVVTEASCSVRVARATDREGADASGQTARIIIGMDGSACAGAAVDAVAARSWPTGSEARLVTATKPYHMYGETPAMQKSRVRVFQDAAIRALSDAGLVVSSIMIEGDPKRAIINEADDWGAGCIFIGSRGLSGAMQRFFLGSVSAGVVTDASCSVEVVRSTKYSADRSTEEAVEEEGVGKTKVSDVMTKDVIALRADTSVQEIARLFKERRISGAPVIGDRGEIIGMVSEDELFLKQKAFPHKGIGAPALFDQFVEPENIAEIYKEARYLTAADVMSKEVVTVDAQDQVGQVAETMMRRSLRRVPVTHDGKLVGIIARSDIIDLLAKGADESQIV
jgi:nucleotide-binding universal stress UspA family protein